MLPISIPQSQAGGEPHLHPSVPDGGGGLSQSKVGRLPQSQAGWVSHSQVGVPPPNQNRTGVLTTPNSRTEFPPPPPQDRTAERVPATRRAVCLLLSRRTFYRPRTYVRWEVMFSQVCVCSTFGGGGYPIPSLGRGVPHPRSGQGGYPISGRGGGSPHLRSGGYPVPGPGGDPISGPGGYPIPCPGGVPPPE